MPRDEVGFRLQVTAANTTEEVDRLLAVLDELAAAIPLRSAASHPFRPRPNGGFHRGTLRGPRTTPAREIDLR